MKTQLKLMLLMIAVPLIVFTGCKKNDLPVGAKKFSGIGYLDAKDVCNFASQGATFALTMTGDLEGCLYVFIDEFSCTNGNYLEKGRELFIGTYKGKSGSFRTTYDFQAKFEGCNPDGTYAGAEISGQCQHPIVKGSGTGVFAGVTGRFDMIDNVKADPINYPYLGYFKF
jgi:hypothetical protein